jgi:hypothetical protein
LDLVPFEVGECADNRMGALSLRALAWVHLPGSRLGLPPKRQLVGPQTERKIGLLIEQKSELQMERQADGAEVRASNGASDWATDGAEDRASDGAPDLASDGAEELQMELQIGLPMEQKTGLQMEQLMARKICRSMETQSELWTGLSLKETEWVAPNHRPTASVFPALRIHQG